MLNALAAIALAWELEIDDEPVCRALEEFAGIDRRLQVQGEYPIDGGRALYIDDYGHHPTEIEATMQAVRTGWPSRRLVLVFQPHRYTRTRDLLDDFADVLSHADRLIVTEVYPAGEAPIANADGRAICRAVRSHGRVEPVFVADTGSLSEVLSDVVEDGDIVLTMGAGNIGSLAAALPDALTPRPGLRVTR